MGRRSSGLFEIFVKSAFGFGSTTHYKKDWLGHSQKVVKYHDSGKKKTYTHGTGFFGNTTKTKTQRGGQTIEKGYIKKNLLWDATEHAERADGTRVTRKYKPGLFKNHVTAHVEGNCWNCSGKGYIIFNSKQEPCMKCGGSGRYSKTKYK
jgi:hypothetical protein